MRRKILMALLAFGVVGGYGSGMASCAYHAHRWHAAHGAMMGGPCGAGASWDARPPAGPPGPARADDARPPAGPPGHAQAGDARPRGPWHW